MSAHPQEEHCFCEASEPVAHFCFIDQYASPDRAATSRGGRSSFIDDSGLTGNGNARYQNVYGDHFSPRLVCGG